MKINVDDEQGSIERLKTNNDKLLMRSIFLYGKSIKVSFVWRDHWSTPQCHKSTISPWKQNLYLQMHVWRKPLLNEMEVGHWVQFKRWYLTLCYTCESISLFHSIHSQFSVEPLYKIQMAQNYHCMYYL